jgi:twitching motility two-component system response regulator PilH
VPTSSSSRKILIVEDDPQLRELYRNTLRTAGYIVAAVEDGADALRQIEYSTPALVVLDLALPRVDGRDVHRELKARPETCNIPVIIVTGTDMADVDAKQFAYVLRKPCDPERLVDAVDQCMRRAGGGVAQVS